MMKRRADRTRFRQTLPHPPLEPRGSELLVHRHESRLRQTALHGVMGGEHTSGCANAVCSAAHGHSLSFGSERKADILTGRLAGIRCHQVAGRACKDDRARRQLA